ncbi:hypothetical protein LguiA_019233 [Lonicera macranthoides]
MSTSLKVAVIGAGVSGLLAGRELLSEGHQVVIYEKMDRPGGTWIYDPRVDSDPLGFDPDREVVHGSLYKSLRTNLPRPAMGFSDYPLEDRVNGDARIFPGHEEVLKFLEDFASDFGLGELIRFGSEVVRVDTAGEGEWVVESRSTSRAGKEVELFDAVVVCNGHHTEPRLPNLPGIEKWPGKQIHSHNYRVPEPFRDQVVVMIGSGPSAYDISREIATVAKEVHLSSRTPGIEVAKFKNHDNMWQHSKINYVDEDGTVAFEDGFSIQADTIFHCTGYKFHFPFLKTKGIVSVEDNRVGPLYKHVFPPQLAPRLSFIGLPQKAIIFRMLELQAKWVAKTLSGKVILPSKEEMMADVEEHYRHMEELGIPTHHTHSLNPLKFEYLDWLADQVGSPLEDRIKEIYTTFINYFISNQDGFRDKWELPSQQLHM